MNNPVRYYDPTGSVALVDDIAIACVVVVAAFAIIGFTAISYAQTANSESCGISSTFSTDTSGFLQELIDDLFDNEITIAIPKVGPVLQPNVNINEKDDADRKSITITKADTSTRITDDDRPRFPISPFLFKPRGLTAHRYNGRSGLIIKWQTETGKTVFEWDEDRIFGDHYHIVMFEKHEITHYRPGDLIPEPWASEFFY